MTGISVQRSAWVYESLITSEIAQGLEKICDAQGSVRCCVSVQLLFWKGGGGGGRWGWAANGKNMQTSDILFTSLGSLHLLSPLPLPSSLHLSLGGRSHSFSGMLISLCHGPLGHIGRGLDPSPPVSLEPIN